MNIETKLFWATADCLRIGTYRKMLEMYGSLENARKHYTNTKEQILRDEMKYMGIHPKTQEKILKKTRSLDLVKAKESLKKYGGIVLCHDDDDFPESLKTIDDAPVFLFAKGDFTKLTRKSIAVVGSRTVTADGKWACESLLPELSQAGFTLVSGMASGVDTLAHTHAIQQGTPTVAFWGTGLDCVYPSENRKLAQDIMKNGVVFSEFPFGTSPTPYNFPRRNRLVSGFSDGVLVIEGKEKSGSLITANCAKKQGKYVFAVPGSIRSPFSKGPNTLIQDGATLVQSASDILKVFGVKQHTLFSALHNAKYVPKNSDEKNIYKSLSYSPQHFDTLVKKTGIPAPKLSSLLMMMALAGGVEEIPAVGWVRR